MKEALKIYPDLAARYTVAHEGMTFPHFELQLNGSCAGLSMRGSPKQIEETYNLFNNYGIATGELFQNSDNFAYVYTHKEKLIRGLMAIYLNRLLKRPKLLAKFKGKEGGIFGHVKKIAEIKIRTMPRRRFITDWTKEDFSKPVYASSRN